MSSNSLSVKQWCFAFGAIIIVVFVAWGESLKGYFIADDVWHVPLVYKALHGEPSLIWRQFLSPYSFHESLYRMYRPLTDISFGLDCLLWNGNAFGYHLTNVLWHLISSCLVFVLSRSLLRHVLLRGIPSEEYIPSVMWVIPLMVSLIFAVYPGHAEPVCWALPRIDSIAAAFTFGSFICSLEYFAVRNRRWLYAATLAMIFGLSIKEMCAAIPLVVVGLFLIGGPASQDKQKSAMQVVFRRVLSGIALCWPMFAVLLIYIAVRSIALGTLLGGYWGTIGASLNDSLFIRLFNIDAYWKLLHPINESVMGSTSWQDMILRNIYFLLAILILVNQKTVCAKVRLQAAGKYLFLLLILVLPCIQIWGINDGLIGARLAYTLCVPFILTVVVLIYPITSEKSHLVGVLRKTAIALLGALFMLFLVMAMQYARAWSDATSKINVIRAQIEENVSDLPDNSKLVIVGLPTGISGYCAFYTIDFLPGLLMPPLSKLDMNSRIICIDGTPTNDRVLNVSLLKELANGGDQYRFILWQDEQQKFVRIAFPSFDEQKPFVEPAIKPLGQFARLKTVRSGLDYFENKQPGSDLESFLLTVKQPIAPYDFDMLELKISRGDANSNKAPQAPPQTLKQKSDSETEPRLTAYPRAKTRYFEPLTEAEFATKFKPESETSTSCSADAHLSLMARTPAVNSPDASDFMTSSNGDDIVLPESTNQVSDLRRGRYGFLSWVGQADNRGNYGLPIHFPVFVEDGIETYRIHLTQYKAWLFSGSSTAFRIDLPEGGNVKLESAVFKSTSDYIPELVFNGQGELNSTGLIQLETDKLPFSFDVSKIPGAKAAFVEVSEPYYEFHFQPHSFRQSVRSKYVSYTEVVNDLTGRFRLPPQAVKQPAYYQIRIAATDSAGNIVGSFSDPITLSNFRLPY